MQDGDSLDGMGMMIHLDGDTSGTAHRICENSDFLDEGSSTHTVGFGVLERRSNWWTNSGRGSERDSHNVMTTYDVAELSEHSTTDKWLTVERKTTNVVQRWWVHVTQCDYYDHSCTVILFVMWMSTGHIGSICLSTNWTECTENTIHMWKRRAEMNMMWYHEQN